MKYILKLVLVCSMRLKSLDVTLKSENKTISQIKSSFICSKLKQGLGAGAWRTPEHNSAAQPLQPCIVTASTRASLPASGGHAVSRSGRAGQAAAGANTTQHLPLPPPVAPSKHLARTHAPCSQRSTDSDQSNVETRDELQKDVVTRRSSIRDASV